MYSVCGRSALEVCMCLFSGPLFNMAGIFTVQTIEKSCVCLQSERSDYQCQWSVTRERRVCDGRAGVARQWEHGVAGGSAESCVASVS